jgi:hypothetical protein
METISRIPFPVKTDLYTRLPIQLELQNSQKSKVEVTITPSVKQEALAAPRPKGFKHETTQFSHLPRLIEEARMAMGISLKPSADNSVAPKVYGFSDSILRIHALEPELPILSMIDLPGLSPQPATSKTLK